jgi:hypothetical protein
VPFPEKLRTIPQLLWIFTRFSPESFSGIRLVIPVPEWQFERASLPFALSSLHLKAVQRAERAEQALCQPEIHLWLTAWQGNCSIPTRMMVQGAVFVPFR